MSLKNIIKKMNKKKFFIIIFFISLMNLQSVNFSIKLKKNLVIKSENEKYLIVKLSSAAIDKKGNIYITDSKLNSIIKFNKKGNFLKKYGRRGQGPGEFINGPDLIEYSEGKIYVNLGFSTRQGILVFNTDLKFMHQINYKKIVPTLFVWEKRLYIPNLLVENTFTFDILSEEGSYIRGKYLNSLQYRTIYENIKNMIIDKNGNMYIISKCEDKIEKWDSKYNKIWSKFIFSGKKPQYSRSPSGRFIPKSFWYKKIALDSAENIYILGLNIAKNYKRDVYVISKTGKLLTIFTLPHKAYSVFRIDKNDNLYVDAFLNEEVALIRYKLLFDIKNIKLEAKGFPAIKKGGLLFEYGVN